MRTDDPHRLVEATRRDAVRRGLAVGGTAIGASFVPALLRARNAFAAAPASEAGILASAIRLENTAAAAYAAAAGNGALSPGFRRTAALFRRQEAAHAAALTSALRGLGATAPTGTDAKLLAPLSQARSEAQFANLAVQLESRLVAAYYDAAKRLSHARLLQTVAQIMANEGQHLVVLRESVSKDPVPSAFVTGKGSG